MAEPLDGVARQLNRELALLMGGLVVAGGVIATAAWAFVDAMWHRHRAQR